MEHRASGWPGLASPPLARTWGTHWGQEERDPFLWNARPGGDWPGGDSRAGATGYFGGKN